LLNAGALSANLKITKGRPVLYFSELSKQRFLIHAPQHTAKRWPVVRIGCWFSRWPSGAFERSAIEHAGVEFTIVGGQPGCCRRASVKESDV
jgi:hypothetical protein